MQLAVGTTSSGSRVIVSPELKILHVQGGLAAEPIGEIVELNFQGVPTIRHGHLRYGLWLLRR